MSNKEIEKLSKIGRLFLWSEVSISNRVIGEETNENIKPIIVMCDLAKRDSPPLQHKPYVIPMALSDEESISLNIH